MDLYVGIFFVKWGCVYLVVRFFLCNNILGVFLFVLVSIDFNNYIKCYIGFYFIDVLKCILLIYCC